MEMTGLDDLKDQILEVAVVITDLELKPLEEYHSIVFQPPEVVAAMNEWCVKVHGASGLTAAIPGGAALGEVEKQVLELISRHYGKNDRVVIVGNSVGNDKRFIDRYMPALSKKLHYRIVDVSSFKEIFRDRYGVEFKKEEKHRAKDDIHESIKELAHYLSFVKIPEVVK